MTAEYLTGEAVLDGWVRQLHSGTPPRRFPVADTGDPLAGVEVGPGTVSLFGGPPGAGKTALVMQLVFEAVRLTPTLRAAVCNVEMPPQALLERQLARLSGVTLTALRNRAVTPHRAAVDAGVTALRALAARVGFVRPPYDLDNLAATADALHADLVVLDYVQRINPGGEHGTKKGAVDAVMDAARKFADAGVAVVLVAAVGRQKEASGRSGYGGLNLASFRESSELEYGCDDAYLLAREAAGDGATLRHLKSRNGEPRDIPMRFDGAIQKFTGCAPETAPARKRQTVAKGGDQWSDAAATGSR